jgi:hypothetical protein
VKIGKIWLIVFSTIFHIVSVLSNLAILISINVFAFIQYNKCTIQDLLENAKIDDEFDYYCSDLLKFGYLIMGLINIAVSILFCIFLYKLNLITYKNRSRKNR